MQRRDAAGIERQLVARFVAHPQHDRMPAKVEDEGEGAPVPGCGRQGLETVGARLQRGVPAVVGPWRMGDADLAEHLRSEVKRSEEHTSELQSLMRISYAVFCLKKKKITQNIIDSPIR